jgi:hypothetical protein
MIQSGTNTPPTAGGELVPECSVPPVVDAPEGGELVPECIILTSSRYLCWWSISPHTPPAEVSTTGEDDTLGD